MNRRKSKTNDNKSKKSLLWLKRFLGVGFVVPLAFCNIAEANNFGKGSWTDTYALTSELITADDLATGGDKIRWGINHDGTAAASIDPSTCVVITDTASVAHKFKIVDYDTTTYVGKKVVTLWSYDDSYGTTQYNSTTSKAYDGSILQSKLTEAYNALPSELQSVIVPGTVTTVKNQNLQPATNLEIQDNSGSWGFTDNAQRNIESSSWIFRVSKIGSRYSYNPSKLAEDGSVSSSSEVATSELGIRPVMLIVTEEMGAAFTAKTAISSEGVFGDDSGTGDVTAYVLDGGTVPTFTPGNGVTLDGSKIGIDVTDDGTYAAAGLLTTSPANSTWDELNVDVTEGTIAYMAKVKSEDKTLDFSGVTAGSDYTLKIFGMNGTNVTKIAAGGIDGLSKDSDGIIHMKVKDDTGTDAAPNNDGINSKVAVTLKNGATVDLAGDASNAITVSGKVEGTNTGEGRLNLGANNFTGKITNAGTLTVDGTTGNLTPGTSSSNSGTLELKGGTLAGAITNTGTVKLNGGALGGAYVTAGTLEFAANTTVADASYISTATNVVDEGKTLELTSGTLDKAVANSGTVKLNGASIGGAHVTAGTLEFAANTTVADASYIAAATNTVDGGVNLTVKSGTMVSNLGGDGNVIIGDGTVQTVSATIPQLGNSGTLAVADNATLKLTGGTLNKAVANSGTVILNGATLGGAHVTAGTLEFASNTTIADASYISTANNVVDAGKTLTINSGCPTNAITNNGRIELKSGTLASAVITNNGTVKLNGATLGGAYVTAGRLEFAADTTIADASYISMAVVWVGVGKTLTINSGCPTNAISNYGTIELKGGTLASAVITNNGTVKLNGATLGGAYVTAGTLEFAANTTIADASYISTATNVVGVGKTLTINSGCPTNAITNNGTIELKSGTLASAVITNNGTVKLNGASLGGAHVTAGTLEFAADTTVADASYIVAATNTIDGGVNLTVKRGTFGSNLSGDGNLVIGDGTVQTVSATVSQLGNSGTLTVTDNATLELTSGTLNKAVANSGTVKLNGASLGGAHVTAGRLEFAANATIADASYISTAMNVVDSGVTLELTGGNLGQNIYGYGTVKLDGATLGAKVTSKLELAQNITVSDGGYLPYNTTVDSGVNLTLTGGTLTRITGDGNLIIGDGENAQTVTTTTLANFENTGTKTVAANATLELTAGSLSGDPISNNGTIKISGTTTLPGAYTSTTGKLEIGKDLTLSDAGYLGATENIVDEGVTLTLNGGEILKPITNHGTVGLRGVDINGHYLTGGTVVVKGMNVVLADASYLTCDRVRILNRLNILGGTLCGSYESFAPSGGGTLWLGNGGGTVYAVGDYLNDSSLNISLDSSGTLVITDGTLQAGRFRQGCVRLSGGGLGKEVFWRTIGGIGGGVLEIAEDSTVSDISFINGNTNTINAGKTLTLTGGTAGDHNELTGAGNLAIGDGTTDASQTVSVKVSHLGYSGTTTVADNGILELTEGTMAKEITNAGVVTFAGGKLGAAVTGGTLNLNVDMDAVNASHVLGDTNNIGSGKNLELTSGNLTKDITNSGTLKVNVGAGNNMAISGNINGGTVQLDSGLTIYTGTNKIGNVLVIAAGAALDPDAGTLADDTTNNGDLYLDGGTLGTNIKGNGTTYLKENASATSPATVTVEATRSIIGTLDGCGGTLDMSGAAKTINSLNIGTLTGDVNLKLDVDMSNLTADKLVVGTLSSASLDVDSINVVKDITPVTVELPKEEDNAIVYVEATAGSATYTVNGTAAGLITVTNDYIYTFSKGTTAGTLKYKVEETPVTFKEFVEGTLPGYTSDPATLSLTRDMSNDCTGSDSVVMGTNQSNAVINVNLNGHNLTSATASVVTINNGKTFNLDGGSTTAGSTDENTAFSIAAGGNLAVSGKIILGGAVTNAGNVSFAGTIRVNGQLSGAGTYSNSGIMTVENAANLAMTGTEGITNTGTINIGGASASVLGVKVNGGVLNINGNISSIADNIAGSSNILGSGAGLTLTEGTLGGTLSGDGNVVIGDGTNMKTVTATALQLRNAGTLTVTDNATLELTSGTLNKAVANSGTVKLNGASLGGAHVTAGTLEFAADTTVADASYIAAATNTVDGGVNLTVKSGTMVSNLGGDGNVIIGDGTVQTVSATIPQLGNSGTLTVTDNATLELTSGTLNKAVANSGTVKLNGASLGGAHVTAGTLEFAADVITNADYVAAASNKVDSGVTLELTSGTLNKAVANSGTVKLNGASLGGAHVTAGTLEFAADVTTNADYVAAVTNKVDSGVTLELTSGTLNKAVSNFGTVKLNGATLAGAHVIAGTLEFAADTVTNADYVTAATNKVDSGVTLELTEGTLSKNVTNTGTVKINGDMTISGALNGGTGGKLVVESGRLVYTNTTAESITNNVEIKAGATMAQDTGVFANGTSVTNYGTLELTEGILKAAIDGRGGDNLVMNGRVEIGVGGSVKQTANSNITVDASTIVSDSPAVTAALFQGVDAGSDLVVDHDNSKLTLTGAVEAGKYYVLVAGTAVTTAAISESSLWNITNIIMPDMLKAELEYYTDTANGIIGLKIISSVIRPTKEPVTLEEKNTSGLVAVQQGAITISKEFTSEVENHLGMLRRPAVKEKDKAKVRNVASTAKDDYEVEVVEQGKAADVMPVKVADKDKYDKEVWASYIRTKETTEGMKLGAGLEGNNTAQYNGTVVGVDFYSSKKVIAGMALGYTTGDIDSHSNATFTRNKSKYYGVSFYDRVTNGNNALIYDIGYIRGDNDISQFYTGKETTADVKTNTYTAGARWEAAFETGRSKVVPFAAFRYMRINSGDYTNSNGTKFETKNQNLYIPKVGIAWTGDFIMPKSVWTWRPSVEAGYVWNLGDRTADSNVLMGTSVAGIEYDTVDKSSYYAKAGMEFMHKNFTAGLFYRYLKGSAVRNNKWNINVSWAF